MKLYASKEPLTHSGIIDYTLDISDKYRFLTVSAFGQDSEGRIMPIFSVGSGEKTVIFAGVCENAAHILMRFIDEFCFLCQSKQNVFSVNPIHIFNTRKIVIIPALSLSEGIYDDTTVTANLQSLASKTNSVLSFTLFDNSLRRINICYGADLDRNIASRAAKMSYSSGYNLNKTPLSDNICNCISESFRGACIVGCGNVSGESWLDKYLSLKRTVFEMAAM